MRIPPETGVEVGQEHVVERPRERRPVEDVEGVPKLRREPVDEKHFKGAVEGERPGDVQSVVRVPDQGAAQFDLEGAVGLRVVALDLGDAGAVPGAEGAARVDEVADEGVDLEVADVGSVGVDAAAIPDRERVWKDTIGGKGRTAPEPGPAPSGRTSLSTFGLLYQGLDHARRRL